MAIENIPAQSSFIRNGIRPYLNFRIQFMDGRRLVLVPVGGPPVPDHVDDSQTIESSSDMHGAISTTGHTQNIQTSESGRSSNTTVPDQSQVTMTQNHTDSPS